MPGQSLSEIRAILDRAGLRPQHQFGQNFLFDLNLMRKLADAADISRTDCILEIGPGTGSLTEILLDRAAHVIAAEIDHGLIDILRERFAAEPRFTLVPGDALETKHRLNPAILRALTSHPPTQGGACKLVANLPYQIATPLMLELLIQRDLGVTMQVCTIQREVADRLVATVGTDAYGPATVIAQSLAHVELLSVLPASVFWPKPKVESAFIRLRSKDDAALREGGVTDPTSFALFVQRGFQQRRKMLRRSMRDWSVENADAALADAGLTAETRPEQVSPAGWRDLHRCCRPPSPA